MTASSADRIELTPREAAELAGVPKRMIEKAIEEKILAVRIGPVAGGRFGRNPEGRRLLGPESVAYAAVLKSLGDSLNLTATGKKLLVKRLKAYSLAELGEARVEIAPAVTADIGGLAGTALERTRRYVVARDAWISACDDIKGGLPVVRGTRITVHSVEARMRGGDSLEDIAAENPDIPREAFEAALLFARTHPLAGRRSGSGIPRAA